MLSVVIFDHFKINIEKSELKFNPVLVPGKHHCGIVGNDTWKTSHFQNCIIFLQIPESSWNSEVKSKPRHLNTLQKTLIRHHPSLDRSLCAVNRPESEPNTNKETSSRCFSLPSCCQMQDRHHRWQAARRPTGVRSGVVNEVFEELKGAGIGGRMIPQLWKTLQLTDWSKSYWFTNQLVP